jgi:predicted unusual protein kinase regulating ubiquinone biosynthesis (AarF/ABC1/UbiB family)
VRSPPSRRPPAGLALADDAATFALTVVTAAVRTAGAGAEAVRKALTASGSQQAPDAVKAPAGGQRRVELVLLSARTAVNYVAHRARLLVTPARERKAVEETFQLRTAADVADALGNMKGALMKVGQIASYVGDGLPEAFRTALADLQQDAPPMSAALAAQVVEEELGAPPDQIFAAWDDDPMAAASIGQVHRAVSSDGTDVAVKVQYPGVDRAIRSDLANAGWLFALLGQMFPGMQPGPIVEEIRARLLEELDYRVEAANQRLFVEYYADHPFIEVPAVIDRYSTARVLTTELAHGARFDEMERWAQGERDLAGEAIVRFVFRSFFRMHAFNGDPHPGNYLFRPGGRVTFLDFGLVKRFAPDEIAAVERLMKAMAVDDDPKAFRAALETAGFLKAGQPFSDEHVADYFRHFFSFSASGGPASFTPQHASKTVQRLFDTSGPYADIMKAGNAPAFAVVLQRINLGLLAILGRLRATADWRAVMEELWPFVDGPPATELGRQEAAWRARAGR